MSLNCTIVLAGAIALLIPSSATSAPVDASLAISADDSSTPKGATKTACFRIRMGNSMCSATAIASTKTETLLVARNHCFADQPYPGAPFPRANYPIPCIVETLDGKPVGKGIAVDGNSQRDICLIVVGGSLPTADIETAILTRGAECEFWGVSTGYEKCQISYAAKAGEGYPTGSIRTTCGSIPGDSGSGLFSSGKFVGVVWGRWIHLREQGVTGCVYVVQTIHESDTLHRLHRELWDRFRAIPKLPGMPKTLPPDVIPKPVPVDPPRIVPSTPQPFFPRIRRWIWGRW